eukprot:14201802-Alexandrium_andersonii.AAC.3
MNTADPYDVIHPMGTPLQAALASAGTARSSGASPWGGKERATICPPPSPGEMVGASGGENEKTHRKQGLSHPLVQTPGHGCAMQSSLAHAGLQQKHGNCPARMRGMSAWTWGGLVRSGRGSTSPNRKCDP